MRVWAGLVLVGTLGSFTACDGSGSVASPPSADSGRLAASVTAASEGEANGEVVFDFRHMEGNVSTGSNGALRNLNAGGIPWELSSARARLTRADRLRVDVRGLVLAAGAAAGTNPIPQFRAVLSCQVESASGTGYDVVNIATAPVPASSSGDATIDERLAGIPSRCLAPAVFVTAPSLAWFAVSG